MRDVTMFDGQSFILTGVSTHTPHAGRDKYIPARLWCFLFLLTRPMRDVTERDIET